MKYKVGIVILNYQSWEDTLNIIKEYLKQKNVDLVFCIIDNDSPNNSYQHLKTEIPKLKFKDIILIKSPNNSGYAKGNNLGAKALEAYHCDYIVISNNDVYFDSKTILYDLANIYPTLRNPGFISPLTLNINRKIHQDRYRLPSFFDDCLNCFQIYKLFIGYKQSKSVLLNSVSPIQVEIFGGSFLFIDANLFRDIDYFDEDTFLFGEERFWGKKIKNCHHCCYIIPTLTYVHAHSKTINKYVPLAGKFKMLYAAQLAYTKKYRKYGNLKAKILSFFHHYSLIEIKIIDFIQKFKFNNK